MIIGSAAVLRKHRRGATAPRVMVAMQNIKACAETGMTGIEQRGTRDDRGMGDWTA